MTNDDKQKPGPDDSHSLKEEFVRYPGLVPPIASGAWGRGGEYGGVGVGVTTGVGVGVTTGVGVGVTTGVGVGVTTGVGVGVTTGVGVGVTTGVGVGVTTGVGVGVTTGVGVGVTTGVGVGVTTGVGVGVTTGVGVGVTTGVGVGVTTGVGVGVTTGVGVGADIGGGGAAGGSLVLDTPRAIESHRHALLLKRHQELLFAQTLKDSEDDSDRLTPRDLWKTVQISQLAISPCGEWVAFVKFERPTGGPLQLGRIFVKRVGSEPEQEEFPLTDRTLLADTPVWKPDLFDTKTCTREQEERSGTVEILFRARLTEIDVMQLYVLELELPPKGSKQIRFHAVRQLTAAPTHPWAPKWRRFRDEYKKEHNRIYYLAASPERPPVGYDHLVFDNALVGWWDELRLPHDRWKFYEIDPYAQGVPRDLLGTRQLLLDFVYGVWNCWDVHPGGKEMVWAAVNTKRNEPADDEEQQWPRNISTDIYRMQFSQNSDDTTDSETKPDTQLTENIHDDFGPSYSPDGKYIVFAEKQFSTLRADYPRIVRFDLPEPETEQILPEAKPFDVIRTKGDSDTILPLAWKFSGPQELAVLIEMNGRHELRLLTVPKSEMPNKNLTYNEPATISGLKSMRCSACCEGGGSVHDYDVKLNAKNGERVEISSVVSDLNSPSELCFSSSKSDATNFNLRISKKSEAVDYSALGVERPPENVREPAQRRNNYFGQDSKTIEGWLVYPSELKGTIGSKGYKGKEKYPLVQLLHGGPHSAWNDEFHMRFNASLLASQGYVVAMVNFRGSTGTPAGEPLTDEVRPTGVESAFVRDLKKAKPKSVGTVVKNLLPKQGKKIETIDDSDLKGFKIRHLRKIERHADQEVLRQFVGALSPAQYDRLVRRDDESDSKGWGTAVTDVDWVTKKLLERGYIDEDRLAVMGASYGAYLGARLLGWRSREHTYQAYVLHAGVYDALSQFVTDAFWVQYQNFGARPWVRPTVSEPIFLEDDDGDPNHWLRFSRISPLLRSHRVVVDVNNNTAPAVLITHGLGDLRVNWQQSVLLHRMLIDRKVKSRLALYPGLAHRLDQPEPSVQWWKAAFYWLNENNVPPGGKKVKPGKPKS